MNQEKIIQKTKDFVKKRLSGVEGGHDWWHAYRVWNLSKRIAQTEEGSNFIIELGALLHDIADYKFHKGDEEIGSQKAKEFLTSLNLEEEIVVHVENIISNVSFKGEEHTQEFESPELDVVQDADRLDALGAIGIARAFNYGGYKGKKIHDPNIQPKLNMSKEEYKKEVAMCESTTINHFYEKLLLLKDRMNTETGRSIAERRHEYMEEFLEEFYNEWNAKS